MRLSKTSRLMAVVEGTIGKDASEVQPNILHQTLFVSGKMDEWALDNSSYGSYSIIENALDGRNAINLTANSSSYFSVRQAVTNRVETSTTYTISFYAKADDVFSIHLHQMVNGKATVDMDNVTYYASGNAVFFKGTGAYVKYAATFTTLSSFSGSIYVYFRTYGKGYSTSLGTTTAATNLYVCMPKLERGDTATAYLPHESELQGEDGADGADGKDGKDGADGKDGKDGADGTSINIKGTAKAHYKNYTALKAAISAGEITRTEYDLFLLDSSSDYSETYDGETQSGTANPSLLTFFNTPDYTYGVSTATTGVCYVTEDGHLWVCGSSAWVDAGMIKGVDGDGGYSIVVSPSAVIFTDSSNSATVNVMAFQGTALLTLDHNNISDDETVTSTYEIYVSTTSDGYGKVTFTRTDTGAAVSIDYKLKVTLGSNTITITIPVRTLFNGIDGADGSRGNDGDKGDAGADAISYSIVPSSSNIVYYASRSAYLPTSITFSFYKNVGGTQSTYSCVYAALTRTYEKGSSTTGTKSAISITTPIQSSSSYGTLKSITVALYSSTSTLNDTTKLAECTIQVATRATIRGPQEWDDLETGYQFYSGDVGEKYVDIVHYGSNYYECTTTHTKSSTTPATSVSKSDGNWALGEEILLVCAKVLLASLAKIDNLYTEDLYMENEGNNTAIWISPLLKGMAIVAYSLLTQYGRTAQNATDDVWSNPTTLFHGGDLRELDDIYDTDTSGSSTFSQSTYQNTSNSSTQLESLGTGGTTLFTIKNIPAGSTLVVTIGAQTLSLDEGTIGTSSGIKSSRSSLSAKYTIGTSTATSGVVKTIRNASIYGNGDAGGSYAASYNQVTVMYENTGTSALTLYIMRFMNYSLLYNAKVILGAVTISYKVISSEYHSEHAANGVFFGLNTLNYFRAAMENDALKFQIMANNFGLDISNEGALQTINGMTAPLGCLLLKGYIEMSGSTITAKISTFDGNQPEIQHNTGDFSIFLPTEWVSKLGVLGKDNLCVKVTPYNYQGTKYTANIVYCEAQSGTNRGNIEIATYNSSGTQADVPFWIEITFIGDGELTYS